MTEAFHAGSVRAFSEDVTVLEKQQAMIECQTELHGQATWIDINADHGGLLARREIKRLFIFINFVFPKYSMLELKNKTLDLKFEFYVKFPP